MQSPCHAVTPKLGNDDTMASVLARMLGDISLLLIGLKAVLRIVGTQKQGLARSMQETTLSVIRRGFMSNAEVLIKLRDLHEELSAMNEDLKSVNDVDDETIEALGQLVTDVSVLVDQAKATTDQEVDALEGKDLLDRIIEFESEHPRVTKFLSQVTDVLSMMGI